MIWTFAGRRHSTLFALFCVIYVPRQLEADNEIRGNVEASSNSSLPELQQLGEKECDNCDESGRERFSSDGNDFSSEGGDDEQIIMTAVVWRHGDRTPTGTYKADTHQEDSWPQGWGQLTPLGMEQQFRLGRRLRREYVDRLKLLSVKYERKEIHVKSTTSSRAVASAVANLVGMYGEAARPGVDYPIMAEWPTGFVPIPIDVDPAMGLIANTYEPCARRDRLFKMVAETAELKRCVEEHQDLLDALTSATGEPITLANVWTVMDALTVEKIYGRRLPVWADDALMARVHRFAARMDLLRYGVDVASNRTLTHDGVDLNAELRRVRGGAIFKEMIDRMRQRVECSVGVANAEEADKCQRTARIKYLAYSAHDTTLAGLLVALNVRYREHFERWPAGSPPYSTAIALELWRRTANISSLNDFHVKLRLWEPDHESPASLTEELPCATDDGGRQYPFSRFVNNAVTVVPRQSIADFCANLDFSSHSIASAANKASYFRFVLSG